MRSRLLALTFIFFLVSHCVLGQENNDEIIKKKMMVFDLNELQDMVPEEISFIRKSVIEAVFAAKIFEITFGHVDEKINKSKIWYEISVSHKKNNIGLSELSFYFKEKPSGSLINFISEKNLPRAKVQYRSRVLAYKLMFGKWFDEKSGVLERPVVVNLNEKIAEREDVPPIDISEEEKAVEEEIEDIKDAEAKIKKKKEEEIKKEEEKRKNTPESARKKKVEIQKFESPDLNLVKNKIEPKKEDDRSRQWMSKLNYSLGYQKESVLSDVNLSQSESLETETSIQRLALKISSSLRVKQWIQHFHYGVIMSKVMAEEQYNISPRINLFGNFNYDILSSFLFLGLNLEYDKLGYVNIASRGEGLKAFSSNILWAGIGVRYIDQIRNTLVSFEADMKKATIANSNISSTGENVPIDGNKLHLQARVSLYGSWGVGLSYENIVLTSVSDTSLNNNHSILGMYLTYN